MGLLDVLSSGSMPGSVTAGFSRYYPQFGRKGNGGGVVAFQYFPERISDSRAPNYAQKEIPGGSHPLYQFVSGGERVLSFDAVFANDRSGDGGMGGLIGGVLGFLGGAKASNDGGINNNNRKDVVDIAAAIDTLRSFTYPTYEASVSKPPPLIEFYLPGSGITAADGNKDSIIGILGRCDVAYEAFHRNGVPRIAVVSLEIREVVQTEKNWKFTDGDLIAAGGFAYNREHKSSV